MDEQKQAEVVTLKEAVEKVKTWIKEKDFEKAKQGCEEILAVEKDNTEVKALLDQANQGLPGDKPAETTPEISTPVTNEETVKKINEVVPEQKPKVEPQTKPEETPSTIMKKNKDIKPAEIKEEKTVEKKHFPIGKLILIILLILIIGGLVFAFIQGWLNPIFKWAFDLLGL